MYLKNNLISKANKFELYKRKHVKKKYFIIIYKLILIIQNCAEKINRQACTNKSKKLIHN